MDNTVIMQIIARVHTPFPEKFGIPRQSGLAQTTGELVFEPAYRNPEALRGIEGFSHLWLLWQFDRAQRDGWSPTVRPPRLGGNARVGVFATRSPFRPNGIGLSCVRLVGVDLHTPRGPVLHLAGADLLDGTPVFDIKPYLPYADAYPQAVGGFAAAAPERLAVVLPPACEAAVPAAERAALRDVLAQDPRPAYQNDPQRVYKMAFGELEVHFTVEGETLTVRRVLPRIAPPKV